MGWYLLSFFPYVYAAIALPVSFFNGFNKLEKPRSSLNDVSFNKTT